MTPLKKSEAIGAQVEAHPEGEGGSQPTGLGGSTQAVTPVLEYRTAFRSAGIMGGVSALNMVIGLVRAKVMAVLLGPTGTGLTGLYQQVTGLVAMASRFGITASGVRQIAEAAGAADATRIARTDRTVRRVAWLTGSLGCLVQLSLCWFLSQWTFGDTVHWEAIAALSVIPLLGALSGARVARIQGLRRIGYLARQSVLGALAGTASGIALIWYFRFKGIVPQLIVVSASSLVFSSYYSRKIPIASTKVTILESAKEAKALLGLGFSFMVSGVVGMVATYLISITIAHNLGVQANGLYFAAWSLSGLYANFVLAAMGADYYPRLTAVAYDKSRLLPIVNQQAETALLMATPGIVGTLAFAPWAIHLFYSVAYSEAYGVMRWLILGVFLRLVSWPLTYILLAKAAAMLYLVTEVIHQFINVLLVWVLLKPFGLPGAGVAFALLYVVYSTVILAITLVKFDFRYSRRYLPILSVCLAMTLGAFFANDIPTVWMRFTVGAALSLLASLFCGLVLKHLMGLKDAREVLAFLLGMASVRKTRGKAP